MNYNYKNMIRLFVGLAMLLFGIAYGQSSNVFVRGTIGIKFNTRNQKPTPNVYDSYTIALNVGNSVLYKGTINSTPYIAGWTAAGTQKGALDFDVATDVVNPVNPAQTRNIGRLFGKVAVSEMNVYTYDDLGITTFALGNAARGVDSKFKGNAIGKPPEKKDGFFKSIQKEVLSFSKSVGGKVVAISVSKYDKLDFQNVTLAAGPIQIYPETTVNGAMVYDYARTSWYFQNIRFVYPVDGQQRMDTITGNIRWVESPNRKTNGEGEYQFDVRVNEPMTTESAIFVNQTTDESAFFANDTSVPSLTGTMKYKDTIANGTVIASAISVDLVGNKITKQQVMNLTKLIIFGSIVPFNAE